MYDVTIPASMEAVIGSLLDDGSGSAEFALEPGMVRIPVTFQVSVPEWMLPQDAEAPHDADAG